MMHAVFYFPVIRNSMLKSDVLVSIGREITLNHFSVKCVKQFVHLNKFRNKSGQKLLSDNGASLSLFNHRAIESSQSTAWQIRTPSTSP